MIDQAPSLVLTLIISVLIGYLIGAIPLAAKISRWYGVDIFSVGSGLSGSSNVRRMVGNTPGMIVLVGDLGKGATVVLLGSAFGLEGIGLLIPVGASILGHWKSMFSGFRGGDGVAILGGASVPLFGGIGVVSCMVAMLIALGGQKLPYPSLLSVVVFFATLVVLVTTLDADTRLALEFGGLSALVLAHAINGHRRRRHFDICAAADEINAKTEELLL